MLLVERARRALLLLLLVPKSVVLSKPLNVVQKPQLSEQLLVALLAL
jgi:hypothetical protein